MRAFFWLWVMMLILCLITDSAVYWVARARLSRGLELALDAALVSSVSDEDLIWGRRFAHEDMAEVWGREILRRNTSGALADKLEYTFGFIQENDHVYAQGQVRTELPFLLGSLYGKGARTIAVSKKTDYQGGYK